MSSSIPPDFKVKIHSVFDELVETFPECGFAIVALAPGPREGTTGITLICNLEEDDLREAVDQALDSPDCDAHDMPLDRRMLN